MSRSGGSCPTFSIPTCGGVRATPSPDPDSDLASLRTKAEDKGDHFLVNGVKTWTTLAQYADWIFCLVRTSQEPKQQMGISFLLIDMHSPGVTVNPIITLDQPAVGFQEINTVYFENVVVPKANLVGEVGKGWTCAKYLLEFERGNAYSPGLKGVLGTDSHDGGRRNRRLRRIDGSDAGVQGAHRRRRGADSRDGIHGAAHSRRACGGAERRAGVVAAEDARYRTAAGDHRARARSRRATTQTRSMHRRRFAATTSSPLDPTTPTASRRTTSTRARFRSSPDPTKSSATSWRSWCLGLVLHSRR